MRVLVTGSRGMLAQHFLGRMHGLASELRLTDLRVDSKAPQVQPLNITDERAVESEVKTFAPHWIINCAAYTAVDNAETNYGDAFAVNALGPRNLARAARKVGARLLHISSDYVFGAPISCPPEQKRPWREDDDFAPCGIYGHSKRLGDDFVLDNLPEDHLILRPSWLHGTHGPNFVHTILRLAQEKSELKVVHDQIGSPTWAEWLAKVMVQLIERDARGSFNTSSRGNISWFDFAREVVAQAGLNTVILPQTSSELGRPAPRPAFSTLDVSKLESSLGEQCLDWRDGIKEHLAAMGWRKEAS